MLEDESSNKTSHESYTPPQKHDWNGEFNMAIKKQIINR